MKKLLVTTIITAMMLGSYGCGKKEDKTAESSITESSVDITYTSADDISDVSENEISYSSNTPLIDRDNLPYKGEEYTYGEISIIIPEEWKDKYLIQESDDGSGFSVFQKASYEEEEGLGFIFSICSYDSYVPLYTDGYALAYTPEKYYNMYLPSDVSCAYWDDSIMNEYGQMLGDANLIRYSLNIASNDVNYKAAEYVIPMSEYLSIDADVLDNLTYNDLKVALWEIDARHGYAFDDETPESYFLYSYFSGKSWYEPDETSSSITLSPVEKDNKKVISKKLEDIERLMPYCHKVDLDEELLVDIDGDGALESFIYKDNGPENGKDLHIHPEFTIDGELYDVWDYEQWGIYMDNAADHCFVIDISPYYDGMEVAILDYGPSDDEVTYIYSVNTDGIKYVGTIPGFFLPPDSYFSGLTEPGGITGVERMDYPETSWVYSYYWYNVDAGQFEPSTYEYSFKGKRKHKLLADMTVYFTNSLDGPSYKLLAGDEVIIESTDNSTWVKLKTMQGVLVYLPLERGDDWFLVNPTTGLGADDIFEGLLYAD